MLAELIVGLLHSVGAALAAILNPESGSKPLFLGGEVVAKAAPKVRLTPTAGSRAPM